MADAPRDFNRQPTALGTLQSDGVTPISLRVNPTNSAIKVVDSTTGTASTRVDASRDNNRVPVMMAVSSTDGVTPVPMSVDVNGAWLIQST
jgi:hypothetical protein